MLSVAVIKSSSAAVSYYEKDDYYAEGASDSNKEGKAEGESANNKEGNAEGAWYGSGASSLGLEGAVDRDAFKEILEGNLPNGETLGRIVNGDRQHTPGWDLTFSAPKSVTLLAEVGDDERLFAAHDSAVKAALNWVEKEAAATRTKSLFGGIRRENTGNLVVALFQHDTNRNQDPQLHTHAVVANATLRGDGKWRSLDSKPLFDHKMAAGNVYRAALAAQIEKLGYTTEKTAADGQFEIKGVSQVAIDTFSTRRQEIVESMEKRGLEGAEAAAKAALRTRSTKATVDREALAYGWKERGKEIQFEPAALVNEARALAETEHYSSDTPEPANKRDYLKEAVSRLSQNEAAFSHAKLIQWTLAAGMGNLTVSGAEALIKNAAEKGTHSLYAADIGGQKSWTTTKASQQEQAIAAAVSAGRSAVEPMVKQAAAKSYLQTTMMNSGQQSAALMIATTKDRFTSVVGRPGTGKSFMLGTAYKMAAGAGYEMVGMASTSETARDLSGTTDMPALTIASHIQKVQRELRGLDQLNAAEKHARLDSYSKQVWVVEEASQVNNADMQKLTGLVERLNARMVLVGDPQQLAAIDAGKPMVRMLDQGIKRVEMDEIRRQSDERHIQAVRAAIDGDTMKAMDHLKSETLEVKDRDLRLKQIVKAWQTLGNARGGALVLTSTNATKNDLNAAMRDVLRSEGVIKQEIAAEQLQTVFSNNADRKAAEHYKVNDAVRFSRDFKSLGVAKDEYWRVTGRDARQNQVTLKRGDREITWNPRQAAGSNDKSSLYRPRETSLATGEKITWTRIDKELGLTNGQQLTVISSEPSKMVLSTEDGRRITLDPRKDSAKHWDHGYATTVYKSQGKTAQTVLVNADSADKRLFSQKAFLVAISRQKDAIAVYTDDKAEFTKAVQNNLGDKTSALEARQDANNMALWNRLEKALSGDTDTKQKEQQPIKQPASQRPQQLER